MTFDQEMLDRVDAEIKQMPVNPRPFIDEAADERAKIVAWLQKDGILNWLADKIEAGEYLK